MKKPELLAPAGSFDSMRAAINASADAVYIGGKQFSARAFANNLDTEELKKAIDYCHIHDRKLYLTINTLLKEREFDELYDYLLPLYQQGLDAVIVQDIGVLKFIKDNFTKLPIHASTQMTAHQTMGVQFLKQLGAERVVLSRELNLSEIKNIKNSVDVEIESFVHGALCYCYSGQCLMSSMLGGRSGNRGRCAQTCRLPYRLMDSDKQINNPKELYLLSPKDICTIDIVPELIESGIDSFKIEGRMKRAEYVAGVVSIYRKYIDMYYDKGREKYSVEDEDMRSLMDLFNRGGFTSGYYNKTNGRDMISLVRPNHWGTKVGKVIKVQCKSIIIELEEDVNPKDQLEVWTNSTENYVFTNEIAAKRAQQITIYIKNSKVFSIGQNVYRTRNEYLLNELSNKYLDNNIKESITGKIIIKKNEPIQFTVNYREREITVSGDIVEAAVKQPTSLEKIQEQLKKTGNTAFVFEHLDIELEQDVFVPIQSLNQIRRNVLNILEESIINEHRREIGSDIPIVKENKMLVKTDKSIVVSIEKPEHLDAVLPFKQISKIYLDSTGINLKDLNLYIDKCHSNNKQLYLILPPIFRDNIHDYYNSYKEQILNSEIDGFVVKNYEEYNWIKDSNKEIILDYNLYVFNSYAKDMWNELGVTRFTASPELNYKELKELDLDGFDILAYGHLPLMTSSQCLFKTTNNCKNKSNNVYIRDRYNKAFYIKNNCKYCYNIIYNGQSISLLEQRKNVNNLNISNIRLHFTFEEIEDVKEIIKAFIEVYVYNKEPVYKFQEFTRGHFQRGIE